MCVLVALHDDVIDVSDQIFPLLLIEYFIGHSRKRWAYVAKPLGHPLVTVRASRVMNLVFSSSLGFNQIWW